ncbi:MFS transporter [Affinibrenneria salicis]|uniref:MFS transporter n=1 Tax=Affinibrenneria salicis TaxID=2590031 RepID=A0A5J5FT49_9GAMM|nr:MFS transporter [Affinibrenneria salicis]KAA8996621.1 MFS transporter [Affinibrenneria salicis]
MLSKNKSKELSAFGVLLLVAGQVLPQLDFSIVNVALDVIGKALKTDETGLVLIVALYGLIFAALIATGSRLGDKYGRKRLFMIGIIGFCIASAICGFATDIISMLAGRVFQGFFAALLMPQILATIHTTLDGDRHRNAVGIYTSIAGLSVVIGQMVGGWLVSANLWNLGWRIAFFMNVPVCLVIFILGYFVIPETKSDETQQHMDVRGIVLFILCLLLVMIPVSLAKRWPELWWLLPGAVPCGLLLWRVEKSHELAGRKPILPPSLFKTPMVINGFISEMTVTFTYPGYLFVTALCLQSAIGFAPFESGNSFIALGVMFFIGSLISKPLSQRIGDPKSFALGSILSVVGFLATVFLFYNFNYDLKFYDLWIATGAVGLGDSIRLTSAYRIALSRVGKHHASEASSALVTVQQGCAALGTAFTGAIYSFALVQGYLTAITISISVVSLVVLLVGGSVYIKITRELKESVNRA